VRTWQVFAGIVAVALLATAAYLLRKNRRPSQVLFVLLLVPIPAAGFGLYALVPGAMPSLTVITLVALVLLTLAVFPAFYGGLGTERRQGRTWTIKDLITLNRYLLARRGCALLGVTAFLFVFEPWFAYANLAAIVAWVAIWIPRGRRVMRFEVSGEIRAAAHATFRFMVEPANWSRYSDSEVVSAKPDGPIAVGTELTIRRTIRSAGDGTGGDWWLVRRSRITALAGTSMTTASLDRQATTTTDVRSIGPAAIVTQRSVWIVALTDAILGLWLENRGEIEAAEKRARVQFQKLNDLIGGRDRAASEEHP
jgi:hypothetical protein